MTYYVIKEGKCTVKMTNRCRGEILAKVRCKRKIKGNTYCYSHVDQKPYNDKCPVCSEDGDIILECRHLMCSDCYHKTIMIKPQCPICRAKVNINNKHCMLCSMVDLKSRLSMLPQGDDVVVLLLTINGI